MTHDPTAFAPLGLLRFSETTFDAFLDRVAVLACQAVPGTEAVSITLVGESGAHIAAAVGDIARRLDEHQRGPGLEAAASLSTVSVPDTGADSRWGHWAAAGVGSMLSVGLPVSAATTGALTLYGGPPHAFDGDSTVRAEAFAGYAAVAVANAHMFYGATLLASQMQAAMHSRAVIEQAKGVIMAQRRCGPDEAFARLTKASQASNRKVRDVAAALIGDLARNPIGTPDKG
ncbi:GAF and ANTAR domain-containing protein [Actinoplanes sp. LDG1-06]|uniref:GAF and ANTAR domain-containing protein n=1 Tax=Paractinoplanes ovalisporus TaxID=2810368 RepID=A0ABS2A953_9ACTN|nr:GAF and ANTAR domain-containing protein [Actinoplanes ovalisporus]MBM2615848.1 GAF and ANTAR domain-containing protein [Actinoplanes ovalisporus]